jgi:membrane protein
MIAIVSLYGIISDTHDLPRQLREVSATVPASARTLLYEQMREIVSSPAADLGIRLVTSLAVTLVAGSGGMHALIDGINLAYDREETRGYFRIRLLAVGLTFGVVSFTVTAVALIALFPHLLNALGLEPLGKYLLLVGRWPGLALVLMLGLSLVYRVAPNGARAGPRWLTFGAVFATLVWMTASLAFGVYSANFGHYNKTYGALAGMVVFMLWVYISTLAILVGAELDAELARFVSARASSARGST